jgi:hypothetical protein
MSIKSWADYLDDNRIGPLMRELCDAIEECEDPSLLRRTEVCLRNLSNSTSSIKWQKIKERQMQELKK